MNKYTKTQDDIYSVFDSTAWKANNVVTYPADYVPPDNSTEFIRLSIIPSGESLNSNSISGVVMIDIYIKAGYGSNRIWEIADLLDSFLVEKSFSLSTSVTQFFNSSVGEGDDPDKTLNRKIYTIPFKHFGVK